MSMMEFSEKWQKADVSIASSGNNTVIAAPTSPAYLAIDHINLLPVTAVTVQLKDGTTSYGGQYSLAQQQGWTIENAVHHQDGIITLSPGNAFVISLGGAVQVSGFVRYRIMNNS